MENITYVTGNYGKYISVKEIFEKENLEINYFNCDLDEPEINDIKYISQRKAMQAYQILKSPCFVADTGFYIEKYPDLPNYPGAFVKRSGISNNITKLLEIMKNETNRKCKFVDCLTYYDGNNFYTFYGVSEGTLSYEPKGETLKKAKSNLWYIFIPKNCGKTLAQMTDEERENRNDGHTSATKNFLQWYKNEYKNNKKLLRK